MAETQFQLRLSLYGKQLCLQYLLGNPGGYTFPAPGGPRLYAALYLSNANVDSGAVTEVSAAGYARQLYNTGGPGLISDGGTYQHTFGSGNYDMSNSTITWGPFTAATGRILGMAITDSPTRGAGHIIAWMSLSGGGTPLNPLAGDSVRMHANHADLQLHRAIYNPLLPTYPVQGPGGVITYWGNLILMLALSDAAGKAAYIPNLKLALYLDFTHGLDANSPLDPDAYPQPASYPIPVECSDILYARQPFVPTSIGAFVDDVISGDTFAPITFGIANFGPFAADQEISGFALMDDTTNKMIAYWWWYHPVQAGSGLVLQGGSPTWYLGL